MRIAAVSNIQQMLEAKKALQEKISQKSKVNEKPTVAQTVARGGTRVAHSVSSKVKINTHDCICKMTYV